MTISQILILAPLGWISSVLHASDRHSQPASQLIGEIQMHRWQVAYGVAIRAGRPVTRWATTSVEYMGSRPPAVFARGY